MPKPPKRKPKRSPKYKTLVGKRVRRDNRRVEQGKKPLAQPLEIASAEERQEALKKGKLVFYGGKQRIELPLVLEFTRSAKNTAKFTGFLQGVYRTGRKFYTLRSRELGILRTIELFELTKKGRHYIEKPVNVKTSVKSDAFPNLRYFELPSFFYSQPDLAHMRIPEEMRGSGIGLKAASKTERDQRSLRDGKHKFEMDKQSTFLRYGLFEKLGYRILRRSGKVYAVKVGKHQPKDNLKKFHRIEAIDPKTGKARIYTFPIKSSLP